MPRKFASVPLRISFSRCNLLNDTFISFSVSSRDIVAYTDIASLKCCIKFGKLVNDLLIEIKQTTVILPQLLYSIFRNITASGQIFEKTGGNPFCILNVTFLTGKLLDKVGIHQL